MTFRLRQVLFILIVAVCLIPAKSSAQQRPWMLSFGGGPSLPMGDLADEARVGVHATGSLAYAPTVLPFLIRAELFYQHFDAAEREPSLNRTLGGEWYRQLSGMLNAVYPVQLGTLRPYALVGVGYTREWHDDRTYWTDLQTTVNVNAGFGFDLRFMGVTGFLELRHLNLFGGDPLSTRPPAIYPEVRLKSIPITMGVRL